MGEGIMDRRIDVETLRTELDEIIASTADDTRIVIQKDGRDIAMLVSVGTKAPALDGFGAALDAIWADVEARGLPPMTMDEIDEEIEAYRREQREAATRKQ